MGTSHIIFAVNNSRYPGTRKDGRGIRKEPFRYQLPGMVAKWQRNFPASFMKRLEQDDKGKGLEQFDALLSGGYGATPAVPKVRPEEVTVPLDSVPPPERRPKSAASASPAPDSLPSRAPGPLTPLPVEEPVRLPYPFSVMNPTDVPEEVWQQARAAKRNT